MQKNILITGASSGIGQATAKCFAEQGNVHLFLAARRQARLSQLQKELTEQYDICVDTIQLDVSDRQAIQKEIQHLLTHISGIDILVNNAGLACGLDPIAQANLDDWQQMIDTNISGLIHMTHALLPSMLQNNRGDIINIGSTAGLRAYAGGSVYAATKHAVNAFTRSLRIECQDSAIRVIEIQPGKVETEFSLVRFKQDKQQADKVYDGYTPLYAEDVARTIHFCVMQPAHVNIAEVCILATNQAALD